MTTAVLGGLLYIVVCIALWALQPWVLKDKRRADGYRDPAAPRERQDTPQTVAVWPERARGLSTLRAGQTVAEVHAVRPTDPGVGDSGYASGPVLVAHARVK